MRASGWGTKERGTLSLSFMELGGKDDEDGGIYETEL